MNDNLKADQTLGASPSTKADQILSASLSINSRLAQLADKLCTLTNQPFSETEALNCVSIITSLRSELMGMNEKIIQGYMNEGLKSAYLDKNIVYSTTISEEHKAFESAIISRGDGMSQSTDENRSQDGPSPFL